MPAIDTRIPVWQAITEIQQPFPDCDAVTALRLINRINRMLCTDYPIYKDTRTLNTISGQQEYSIDNDYAAIRRVKLYWTGATDVHILDPTSIEDEDRLNRAWQLMVPGQPIRFYWDGATVGFIPAPSMTTSGTYPFAEIDILCEIPLTSNNPASLSTDFIPEIIKSHMLYVDGARALYARAYAPDKFQLYQALYEQELADAERYLGRRNRNLVSEVFPQTYTDGVV